MPARQIFDRYNTFLVNGEQTVVPYIKLPSKTSDRRYIYKVDQSRLDIISQQFYGSPTYGWLIMTANPKFGGNEWDIPDGAILTIPYPLISSLQDYKNELNQHFYYYGR